MKDMKWRNALTATEHREEHADSPEKGRSRAESMLTSRGVPRELCQGIAQGIEKQLLGLPDDAAGLVVDGVALAVTMGAAGDRVETMPELDPRVLEQLVGDFSGELRKLDEILRVLSAYLQRLGSSENRGGHLQ